MPVRKNTSDLIGKLAGVLEIGGDVMSTSAEWEHRSDTCIREV